MTHPIADGMVVIAADTLEEARAHFTQCFPRKPDDPDWVAQFDEAVARGAFVALPLAEGEARGVVAHARGY